MIHVVVGKAHRRRGVGHALVAAAADIADELGIEHVSVGVYPSLREASRFYARLGFAQVMVQRVVPTAMLRRRLCADLTTRRVDDLVRRRSRMRRPVPAQRLARGVERGRLALPRLAAGCRRPDLGCRRASCRPASPDARRGCCCSTGTRWPTARSSRCRSRTSRPPPASRPTRSTASRRCSSTSCATSSRPTSRSPSTSAGRRSATRPTPTTRRRAARPRPTSRVRSA